MGWPRCRNVAARVQSARPVSALQFGILGPVEVLRGGRPVPLGGPLERALLGVLLVRAGSSVSSEELVELLWPQGPPPTASATLRSHVSRLRRRLHPDAPPGSRHSVLHRVAGGYRLTPELDAVDSHRFDRLIRDGQEALADGEPRIAALHLRSALALWRGQPFGDLRYEPFAASEAERLEERRAAAMELLAAAEIRLGHSTEAVALLQALVGADPFREAAWALLIEALYRLGRRAEALREYARARQILKAELGVEPGADLRELARAIHDETLPLLTPRLAGSLLPEPLTRLVDREQELRELGPLIAGPGLVTLVGPAGSGKTRLAIEAARRRRDHAGPGGVVWVDLSTVRNPNDVPHVVGSAAGVERDAAPTPLVGLAAALMPHPPLLVMDNCEHVLAACGSLIVGLLEQCPGLTILCTSREPLSVPGERIFWVPPLAVPRERVTELRDAAAFPAVQLFVVRAAEARSGFHLDDENAADVAGIVRRLDGLPLAIELAAVRSRSFTPAELLMRLDEQLRVLDGAGQNRTARHRTLHAAIAWSHELLSEPEQIVFRRASAFSGSFEMTEAEAVCAGGPIARSDVAGILARLVDRSLVTVDPGSPTRYRLLNTLRDFAAEQARRTEPIDDLQRRHRDAYLALVERTAPLLQERELPVALARLDLALPNLASAIRWSLDTPGEARTGLHLAVALWRYWMKRGLIHDGLASIDEALALAIDADDRERAAAEIAAAWLMMLLDDPRASDRAERGAVLAERAGDSALTGWGLVSASLGRARTGAVEVARAHAKRALPLLVAARDVEGQASAFASLGMAAKYGGRLAAARRWFEEALAGYRRLGDSWDIGWALVNLADVAKERGDAVEAGRLARSALAHFQATGDARSVATARLMLGGAALASGELRTADEAYRGVLRISRRRRYPGLLLEAVLGLAELALRRGATDEAGRLLGTAERAVEVQPGPRLEQHRSELRARLQSLLGADRLAELLDSPEIADP